MDKQQLKEELKNIRAKIKANSKDAHFADTLLDELISVKGQIDVEPTLVYLPMKDIEKQVEGETFIMAMMKNGDAVYHVKGGYTIVADGARMYSLAQTIKNYIVESDSVNDMDEEQKEMFDLDMSATTYVMNVPMYAFSDQDLKYDIASMCIKWLRESYEEAMNAELQDEDKGKDAEFENIVELEQELVNYANENK